MTRRLRIATATVGLASALLAVGCQGENPSPAPTAVLPTPSVPAGSPSQESAEQQAANEAADRYLAGRDLAESLLHEGEYERPSEQLSEYFSGQYLSFWETEFTEYRNERWTTNGDVKVAVESAGSHQPVTSTEPEAIKLYACVDFSETTVLDADGKEQERGFDFSLDEVQMVNNSDGWMADSVGSAMLDELEDTPCAGIFE